MHELAGAEAMSGIAVGAAGGSNNTIYVSADRRGCDIMKIEVVKNVLTANEQIALENEAFFRRSGITAFNVMASPGT
jgi:hypothetical protein